jgi:alcohol dehydrogenase class IV
MSNALYMPRYIFSGENALQDSMAQIHRFGQNALIVTDDMMVKLGNVKKVTDELEKNGIRYFTYPKINTEPIHSMVDEGVELYQSNGCDFLIAIGGGSPMDAMKAIGAVVSNGGRITEYFGKKLERKLPPMVAIPTTAGTGSEATKITIITNTDTGVKMPLNDPMLTADMAIVDPVFTLTAPPAITAATGVDALTHAVEAYTSLRAFPMTDIFARSAVRRIFANIETAYANGSDVKARTEMAYAALEAGIAFSNASVTIVHGMSRPIGALFHVPHGQSNAMLLGICLDYLKPGAVTQLKDLAMDVGVYQDGMTDEEAADAFTKAVVDLIGRLNIPAPKECGIEEAAWFEAIPKMSEDALKSGSPGNTRRSPSKEDIMALYKQLWNDQ